MTEKQPDQVGSPTVTDEELAAFWKVLDALNQCHTAWHTTNGATMPHIAAPRDKYLYAFALHTRLDLAAAKYRRRQG
jgi:hypothetical protein